MSGFLCPVCGYASLSAPPANYEICPSCMTEFGYDDFTRTHEELRAKWIEDGAPWRGTWMAAPDDWDGLRQLLDSGLLFAVDSSNSDGEEEASDPPASVVQVEVEAEYA